MPTLRSWSRRCRTWSRLKLWCRNRRPGSQVDRGRPHLTDLTLENTDIHDDTIKKLQSLSELKVLALRRSTYLTDKALEYLKDYPSLQVLRLLYNNFDDDGMAQLEGLKNLPRLDIRGCAKVGDGGLAASEGPGQPAESQVPKPGRHRRRHGHLKGWSTSRNWRSKTPP